MAFEYVKLGIALVFVTTLCGLATAQSGCTSALLGLAPCLNYITGNSTTPASSCCSQLSSVVQSQPRCLCSVLNGGGPSFGITINQTKALSLPGACNVQTLPVSRCNGASGPAAAPMSSAVSPSAATVSSALSPAAVPVSSAVSPAAVPVSSAVSPAAAQVNSTVSPTASAVSSIVSPAAASVSSALSPEAVPVSSAVSPAAAQVNSAVSPAASAVSSAVSPAAATVSPTVDSSDETPDTPAASSMPSIPAGEKYAGTGYKTVPTKEGIESDGSNKKMPIALTLFTLFVASYI